MLSGDKLHLLNEIRKRFYCDMIGDDTRREERVSLASKEERTQQEGSHLQTRRRPSIINHHL